MITFSFLEDFFDLNFDNKDLKEDSFDDSPPSLNDHLVSPLYVPQDPLHELELWHPSFWNEYLYFDPNLISDSNSFVKNDENSITKTKHGHMLSQPMVQHKPCFTKKMPRKRKPRRKKKTLCGTWASFGFVNSKPNKEKRASFGFVNSKPNKEKRASFYFVNSKSNKEKRVSFGFVNSKPNKEKGSSFGFVNSKPNKEKGSSFGFVNSNPNKEKGSSFGFVNSKPNNEKMCSHCETKNSPLWRVGPMGKNTLCNACGVRYKSGRLLPEYRPLSSPTFDAKKHSNYHRKILKMKNRGQQ
ncbi:hypothetical protein Lal_00037932 [Lupinus albus]|nr:hypothetical protein Lal_00037932 [Lupinus albus]